VLGGWHGALVGGGVQMGGPWCWHLLPAAAAAAAAAAVKASDGGQRCGGEQACQSISRTSRRCTTPPHLQPQAVAYEFNTEFSQVLAQRADFYSSDPAADTINRVRGEISQVRALSKGLGLGLGRLAAGARLPPPFAAVCFPLRPAAERLG